MDSPKEAAKSFGMSIQAQISRGPKFTLSQFFLQGMSNIMQKYPAHSIDHFFGKNPMTAAQFFVLSAQIIYEREQEDKEYKKRQKK